MLRGEWDVPIVDVEDSCYCDVRIWDMSKNYRRSTQILEGMIAEAKFGDACKIIAYEHNDGD